MSFIYERPSNNNKMQKIKDTIDNIEVNTIEMWDEYRRLKLICDYANAEIDSLTKLVEAYRKEIIFLKETRCTKAESKPFDPAITIDKEMKR